MYDTSRPRTPAQQREVERMCGVTPPEHSDRAKYVTEQVKLWIANDSDHIEKARQALAVNIKTMAHYLTDSIRYSLRFTAPWHVKQELAPNDYGRIRWSEVADEIRQVDD